MWWFSKDNSNRINSTPCIKGQSCSPPSIRIVSQTVSGGVRHHESYLPSRERKRSETHPPLKLQTVVGVRAGQAELGRTLEVASVSRLGWPLKVSQGKLGGHLHLGKLRCGGWVTPGPWPHRELVTKKQPEFCHCESPHRAMSRVLKRPWQPTTFVPLCSRWGNRPIRQKSNEAKEVLYPVGFLWVYLSRTFSSFSLPFLQCHGNFISILSSLSGNGLVNLRNKCLNSLNQVSF